jgi:hypothetical protein
MGGLYMREELTINYTKELSTELTQYDEKMLTVLSYLGLPTENILVRVDERRKVFKNIEDVLELLETSTLNNSTYISKFLSAVSAGLFDAALNYLWDETVQQLRYRVSQYDIQYFYDLAVTSDKRSKLSTEEDLVKIDDSELIQGAKEIGLISDIGYRLLDNIKYMRNWASAAHPNQVELTGLQLIDWLETCIREVISLPLSNITIQIGRLLRNIKTNILSETEAETISAFFCELTLEKANSLCNGFFGIYCRNDTTTETKRNIKYLLPKLWELIDEEVKWNFGIKFSKFQINNDQAEARLAREFLQIVNAESYLPDSIRGAEIKIELERLYNAHNSLSNNFYLEPPCARQVQNLVGSHGVPQQINSYFTMVIVDAYLTNGNGVCWSADVIYETLIQNFTQIQFFLAVSSFTHDKIASKLQFSLCKKYYTLLLETAKNNVTSPALIKFIEDIQNYGQPLYKLKDDEKIIQQIEHLKKVLK